MDSHLSLGGVQRAYGDSVWVSRMGNSVRVEGSELSVSNVGPLQPPTSGSSQLFEETSPLAVPPTALSAMGQDYWCSEGWWNTANTAMTCTSCRSVMSQCGCGFDCDDILSAL